MGHGKGPAAGEKKNRKSDAEDKPHVTTISILSIYHAKEQNGTLITLKCALYDHKLQRLAEYVRCREFHFQC